MIKNDIRPLNNNYKVCSDCGITHTPLWRGGPNGPKTMCNACGIRWKRAHQNGHKPSKQFGEAKASKMEYLSDEEERDEYDSAEELLALSDPESNVSRLNSAVIDSDQSDSSSRKRKTAKKISMQHNTKPYSRRSSISNDRELEHQAEDSILLLQQAAEEFDRITDIADEPISSDNSASLNGSANCSPTPIMTDSTTTTTSTSQAQMDQLFHEVQALREEVQKRDAIIDMFKSATPKPEAEQVGRNFNGTSPSVQAPMAM